MDRHPEAHDLTSEQTLHLISERWGLVQHWRDRLTEPSALPQAGSLFDLDGKAQPHAKAEAFALTSLTVGSECLYLADSRLLAHEPTVFALDVLYRSALLGAAQALWLLTPSDQRTRLDRARALREDNDFNENNWRTTVLEGPEELQPPDFAERTKALPERMEHKRARPKGERNRVQAKPHEIVKEAALFLYPNDVSAQIWARVTWQRLSAQAHGLPWGSTARRDVEATRRAGNSHVAHVGDIANHHGPSSLAFDALAHAWTWFDSACHAPPTASTPPAHPQPEDN